MIRKISNSKHAFTLIELLIACSLMVIVGFALYQVFSQGIRLWNGVMIRQANIDYLIFSEKLTHDLQNSLIDLKENFEGDSDFVEFNTLNVSRGGGREEIYRIRYAYDVASKSIKRMAWDYKNILNHSPGKTDTILNGVQTCKFQFYGSEPDGAAEWTNRFKKTCLPEALKILVEYQERGNKKNVSRIIPITQGGCLT